MLTRYELIFSVSTVYTVSTPKFNSLFWHMMVCETLSTFLNTANDRSIFVTMTGWLENIRRGTLRFGKKGSRFKVLTLSSISQGKSVFLLKLAEYISSSISASSKSFGCCCTSSVIFPWIQLIVSSLLDYRIEKILHRNSHRIVMYPMCLLILCKRMLKILHTKYIFVSWAKQIGCFRPTLSLGAQWLHSITWGEVFQIR